ncbi:hypothetical protein AB6E95_03095 [Vibrio splendidus]|uniref:Uncharacterized protein n=1 Tax=Vibrio splendidus TaxID=29497 RepID=A0ABV4LWZ3_VIBSP
MLVNIVENSSYYTLEIDFISASDKDDAIGKIDKFCLGCDQDLTIELLSDDYSEYKGNSVSTLKESFDNVDFEDSIKIKINLVKSKNCGKVYDAQAFTSWLRKLDIQDQIKQVATYFNENAVQSIYSTSDFLTFCASKSWIYTTQLNQISEKSFNCKITPFYFEWLISLYRDSEILISYFKQIRNIFSIACICEDRERDNSAFYLSREKSIDVDEILELSSEQGDLLFGIFKWGFEDDNFRLKRSVICSILSIQSSFSSSLNRNILPLLKSNLNIAFKENFNSYIEARSSVMDYLFELSGKLNEQISNTKSSLNNSLLVILSFFFTSVVFTAIDKGKLENIFTYEVSVLSSVFIICSMIYLTFSQLETEHATDYYAKQKSEFMVKYQNIFSVEELEELFNPPSIVDVFGRAKSRVMFYVYQVIMVILTVIIWSLHQLYL